MALRVTQRQKAPPMKRTTTAFVFTFIALLVLAVGTTSVRAQEDPTKLAPPPAGPGPGPGMMVRHDKAFQPPIPPLDLTADNQVLDPATRAFALDGNGHVKAGDELDLYADHISGDLSLGLLDATGNVRVREFDMTISAKAVHFDGKQRSALIADGVIYHPPYTITSPLVTVDGDTLVAHNATITNTAPGARTLFSVRVSKITLSESKQTLWVRNASMYLGHTRLLTIKAMKQSFAPGEKSGLNNALQQQFGYDSNDGLFLSLAGGFQEFGQPIRLRSIISEHGLRSTGISTQFVLLHEPKPKQLPLAATDNVIRTLRALSAPIGLPVTASDPLRFHNFLSSSPFDILGAQPLTGPLVTAGIDGIYHDRLLGRRIGNLLVSRLPEMNISAMFPLGRLRPQLPTMEDPVGLREVLRRPDFVARIIGQYGFYQESPTNASGVRKALVGSIESRAVLIGPNTLLHPIVDFTTNQYEGNLTSYHYVQGDVAIEHLFSNRSMIGIEYIKSIQSGKSPFVFDTLDTTDELDVSAQYGNHRWVAGGRIQYDFAARDVYDYQFSVGPDMGSFVPTIGYDQRSASINFGFSLAGLSF